MSIVNLSSEELQAHLANVATPQMLAQISPEVLQQGLQDMSESLSKPAQKIERGGHSR